MAGDEPPTSAAGISSFILGAPSRPGTVEVTALADDLWQVLWHGKGCWKYDRVFSVAWRKGVPIYLARREKRYLVVVGTDIRMSFDEPVEDMEVRPVDEDLEIVLIRDGRPFFRFRIPFHPHL